MKLEAFTSQTIPQFWPPDSLDYRSELILYTTVEFIMWHTLLFSRIFLRIVRVALLLGRSLPLLFTKFSRSESALGGI